MDRFKLAWHVQATLDKLAARLACTPEQLMAFGVAEDLEAFGEAMDGGEWSDATPTRAEPLLRRISGVWSQTRKAR